MNVQASPSLRRLSVAAALTFAPFAVFAQDTHMMGGGMKGGEMMKGCDMMSGMMGGDMAHMPDMMSMMHEQLSHAGDRVASLKTELKITEAQTPAWDKFAGALLAASKSMEESMEAMHKRMQSGAAVSLPSRLEHHAQMAAAHLTSLQAIKAALDPLYASFSDEQKKLADGQKIGPMGLM